MIISSLILLLLSNAITLRRDKSILYSRIAIIILNFSIIIAYVNLYFLFLSKGIGLFGGLFHTTSITNLFHIFIFLVSSVILLLTSFYPRKVLEYVSPDIVNETIVNNNLLYQVDYEEWEFRQEELNEEVNDKEIKKELDEEREFPVNLPKVL